VIVPTTTVNLLTELALSAALSLGETVVAVAVAGDEDERREVLAAWSTWRCSVPLEVIVDPHRAIVHTIVKYVESVHAPDTTVTVLIPRIVPTRRRNEILHNQRAGLLEAALKTHTDGVVIATLPFHLPD
jgi:hypothetical protein